MEPVTFNGWKCVRLANRDIEAIVTCDVGPRIIRFGFIGGANLFAEIPGQQGGRGEAEWQLRGGHRLWVAPEAKPWSYELDNEPYEAVEAVAGGVRVRQKPGPVTRIAKEMEIVLDAGRNRLTVTHRLTNRGAKPVECAAWAPTVMGPGGQAIIPLPAHIPHSERLLPNQSWSLWGYTDFSDPRWTLGSRYIFFRQDASRGPNKLGLAHREKWVAYQRAGALFIKVFDRLDDAVYPDGGCNFETFSNEQMLEIESLGPLTTLRKGASVEHTETWSLFRDVPLCKTEDDVDRAVRPLAAKSV
jgi:hypothetical protein